MSFDPTKLVSALPPPPAGVKLYKNSFLYSTADAISVVMTPGYMTSDSLNPKDAVSVTSSHPTDGGDNVCLAVFKDAGVITIKPAITPPAQKS